VWAAVALMRLRRQSLDWDILQVRHAMPHAMPHAI
jgi:hypothetical protein